MSLHLLAVAFALVAFSYSFVGFGGGTAYLALLSLSSVPYLHWRIFALVCNLIVVTGGTWHFVRRGHFSWRLFCPFIITSVPMAYIGGTIELEKAALLTLLGICLVTSGIRGMVEQQIRERDAAVISERRVWAIGLPMGAVLGGISGLVGIGGGIFLAPILYLVGWGQAKQVAATASAFILVNSLAALAGLLYRDGSMNLPSNLLWLPVAVFVAGQAGSRLGSGSVSSARTVRLVTNLLVLLVGARAVWKGPSEHGLFLR